MERERVMVRVPLWGDGNKFLRVAVERVICSRLLTSSSLFSLKDNYPPLDEYEYD